MLILKEVKVNEMDKKFLEENEVYMKKKGTRLTPAYWKTEISLWNLKGVKFYVLEEQEQRTVKLPKINIPTLGEMQKIEPFSINTKNEVYVEKIVKKLEEQIKKMDEIIKMI